MENSSLIPWADVRCRPGIPRTYLRREVEACLEELKGRKSRDILQFQSVLDFDTKKKYKGLLLQCWKDGYRLVGGWRKLVKSMNLKVGQTIELDWFNAELLGICRAESSLEGDHGAFDNLESYFHLYFYALTFCVMSLFEIENTHAKLVIKLLCSQASYILSLLVCFGFLFEPLSASEN